ncbi:MAG: hypothetical protein ACKVQV_13505 [Bacteroidia bacterium]
MKKNKLFLLCLTFYGLLLFSCSNSNKNKNEINYQVNKYDSTIAKTNKPEEVFKSWLKDTLINLSNWKTKTENDVPKKDVLLSNDSLLLTIETYYSTFIVNSMAQSGEVSNIIDLLKEYDEMPNKSFTLSFLYQKFYSPPSVEQLKYDFIYEIKDIQIAEVNSKTNFCFIRGRLSGKELIKESKNGKQELIKTDFIWQGDTLIKKRI